MTMTLDEKIAAKWAELHSEQFLYPADNTPCRACEKWFPAVKDVKKGVNETSAEIDKSYEALETRLAENEKSWQADVDTMHGLADDLEKAEARIAKLVTNAAKLAGENGQLRLKVEGLEASLASAKEIRGTFTWMEEQHEALKARHQCLIEMAQRIRRVAENDTALKSYSCVQAILDVLRDHEAILGGEGK